MTQKETKNFRKKWAKWLKYIGRDLGDLLLAHDILKGVTSIVIANKDIQRPTLFHRWINHNYLCRVSIGVRRLRDPDKRSISLFRLIEDIMEHPQVISRDYFTSEYPKCMREDKTADSDFNEFASKRQKILSVSKLKRDLNKLKRNTHNIKTFTDKWIAHCDINRKKFKIPTYEHIANALKSIDELYCRYCLLLTRSGTCTCKPVLMYDWKQPLKKTWLQK